MKIYISSIGTANPDLKMPQQDVAQFMSDILQMDETERRKLQSLYRASGIQFRHSVLKDFSLKRGDFTFFPNSENLEPFPGSADRMELYAKEALPLSIKAIENCFISLPHLQKKSITHLIVVSCTGMYAPGLDIELIEALGLDPSVERTFVGFMGCYAAFNGLKLGWNICKGDPNAKVLVVCVELCTIHFQKTKDADNILSNSLFADGAAAFLIQSQLVKGYNLSLEQFHCDIEPSGKNDMGWKIGDHGFEMRLSAHIPEFIKSGIRNFAYRLLEKINLTFSQIHFLAIHPGGKKILEVIEEELGFPKEMNKYAYNVLRNFGNMSSATVMFVLKEIVNELQPEDDEKNILSFAFGPGLTMESMLLKVCHADD